MDTVPNVKNMGKGIGVGILIAILMATLLSGVGAFTVYKGTIDESYMQFIAIIINGISSFIAAIIAYSTAKQKCLPVIGITAAGYFLIHVIVTVLFFESSFCNIWTSVLSILIGSGIGCAICLRLADREGRRKRSYRHIAQRRKVGK